MRHIFTTTQAWQYSLALYSQEEIKNACLHWQNTQQANVNILLLLAWLDTLGYQLTLDKIAELSQQIEDFSIPYTQNQRALRKRWSEQYAQETHKSQNAANIQHTKDSLLNAELLFEKYEQMLICEFFNHHAVAAQNISEEKNMARYLSHLRAGLDTEKATLLAAFKHAKQHLNEKNNC